MLLVARTNRSEDAIKPSRTRGVGPIIEPGERGLCVYRPRRPVNPEVAHNADTWTIYRHLTSQNQTNVFNMPIFCRFVLLVLASCAPECEVFILQWQFL